MALKIYSIRLDEEEYEKLKKYLDEYGDSELNVGFVLRQHIRSLNKAIPAWEKSALDARDNLSYAEIIMQYYAETGQFDRIVGPDKMIEQLKKKPRKDKK